MRSPSSMGRTGKHQLAHSGNDGVSPAGGTPEQFLATIKYCCFTAADHER